jgi:hypothetical protein
LAENRILNRSAFLRTNRRTIPGTIFRTRWLAI